MDLLANAKSDLAQHERLHGVLMLDDGGAGGIEGVVPGDFEGGSMDSHVAGGGGASERSTYRKRLREAIRQRVQRRRARRADAKAKRNERRAARAAAKALRNLNESPEEKALRVSRRKRLYARYKARRRARAQARETKRAVKRAAKRFKQYGLRYVGQGGGSGRGAHGNGDTYGPGDLPRAGVPPGPPLPLGALPRHLALARDPRFFRSVPVDDWWRLALPSSQQQMQSAGGPLQGKSVLPAHWSVGAELPAKAPASHRPWWIVVLLAIAYLSLAHSSAHFTRNYSGEAFCAFPVG